MMSAGTHAIATARRFATAALDIIYPPVCIACRKATGAHEALCPTCWSAVRFIERPFCERLGTPFEQDLRQPGLLSPAAIANPTRLRAGAGRRAL